MKRITTLLMALLLSASVCLGQAQERHKMVIATIGDAKPSIKKMLSSRILEAFVKSGKFIAIENNNAFLAKLNEEVERQHGGTVRLEDIVEIGRAYGAEYVCTVETSYSEDFESPTYSMDVRLTDVKKHTLGNMETYDNPLKTMADLKTAATAIASKLTQGTQEEVQQQALQTAQELAQAEKFQRAYADLRAEMARRESRAKSAGYMITKNGLAIQTDNVTSDGIKFNDAQKACQQLRIGGKSGWRLPTLNELATLKAIPDLQEQIGWSHVNYWTSDGCGIGHKILDVNGYEQCAKDNKDWFNDDNDLQINARCVRNAEERERYDKDIMQQMKQQLVNEILPNKIK